jgi:DNA repair protein RadA/Sms
VGLTGEVRGISHVETRVAEIKKMGFKRCLVPKRNIKRANTVKGIDLLGIQTVAEATEYLF